MKGDKMSKPQTKHIVETKRATEAVELYISDASDELKELEYRVKKCDNTDIITRSRNFGRSMVHAYMNALRLSDDDKLRLRSKTTALEYKFTNLTTSFEVDCSCSARKKP